MEPIFRDKLLLCEECGNQFVYTVGQQRLAFEQGETTEAPTFCPVCEVKIGRMGRRPKPEGEVHISSNGSGYSNGAPYQPQETRNGAQPLVASQSDEIEDAPDSGAETPQGGRPSNYQTGEAHPLYGHQGEQRSGQVKWFNDRKGFGFITLDDGNELFVHYSGIAGEGYKSLKQGQRVRLRLEDTDKGPQATDVMVVGEGEDEPLTSEQPVAE